MLTMSKEYIDREEALSAIKQAFEKGERPSRYIKSIPAADVVQAVRCQDCVYARPLEDMKYDYLCRYWNGHSCNQNQFCSQGKRKEKTK